MRKKIIIKIMKELMKKKPKLKFKKMMIMKMKKW
jgi:hypothetical protein